MEQGCEVKIVWVLYNKKGMLIERFYISYSIYSMKAVSGAISGVTRLLVESALKQLSTKP